MLVLAGVVAAQTPARNSSRVAGNGDTVLAGEKLYGARCAACHGKNLRGGEGPSLFRSRIATGSLDQPFFDVIRKGIPGTEMSPMPLTDEQIRQVVSFVQSLTKPGHGPPVPGDAAAGRKVFSTAGCGRCHIAEGKGGVIGPDLNSVALRLSSTQVREAVRHLPPKPVEGFRGIIVKTRNGRTTKGILKNQDNFSIQLMSLQGDLISIERRDTVSMQFEAGSLMPSDPVRNLTADEMQNLLAYLDGQRTPFLHHDIGFQTY